MVELPKDDEGHEAREAATRATRARGRAVPAAVGDRALVVAPDGDDAGPGTQEAPIATLHEAQRRLRELPGGTVVLTDGTWHQGSGHGVYTVAALSRLACMFVAEGVVFVPVVRYN